MTHRDGVPRFSARSVWRGVAGHREPCGTLPENLGTLGLQVVIEDYVHHEGAKLAALIVVGGLSLLLGLAGVLAVLTVLFGG